MSCKKYLYLHRNKPNQDVFVKHNAPLIMANSNEGQDHKDKYFDTSRKILSQEMTMCNKEDLVSYF